MLHAACDGPVCMDAERLNLKKKKKKKKKKMSDKEDSVLDAPHKPSQRVTRKASKEAKESCLACGIAISTHLGKAGQGTCFGTEVTKVFSDLLTLVGSVKAELEIERHEARDREARLTRKVSELCKMLAAAETRESDALTKLTTVEKTVQTLTKQVQQLQQEAKKGREGESRSSRTEHEGTIGAQCSSPNEAAKSWHEQTDEIVESRTEHGRELSPSSSRPQQGLARPRTDGTGEYKSQERRPRISASTAARPEHKKRPPALDPNAEDAPALYATNSRKRPVDTGILKKGPDGEESVIHWECPTRHNRRGHLKVHYRTGERSGRPVPANFQYQGIRGQAWRRIQRNPGVG